jgi:hypothetical protein
MNLALPTARDLIEAAVIFHIQVNQRWAFED